MGQNDGTFKGFMVGLLAGSAIGALLALLYAPKTGKEMRAGLKGKADEMAGEADEFIQSAKSRAVDIVSEAKKRSDQLISDAKVKAGSLLEDADKIISGARQKTEDALQEGGRVKDAVKAGVEAYKEERKRPSNT